MKETSQAVKNSIISLLNSGNSIRKVAEALGVGKTTVSKVKNLHCAGNENLKGGRPKILSKTDVSYCVQKVTRKRVSSAAKVAKDLKTDFGIQCSAETVRRALRMEGLGAIEKPKKTLLTPKNIKARLAWCRKYKDWTTDDWRRIIWTDETKINRFSSDGRQWAWVREGEDLQNHHVKLTVKHGGGSIMLWSAITYAGVGWICKIDGNMDKALYKEILEDDLDKTLEWAREKLDLRRDQMIFQQDNDPKHTSNLVKDYLQNQSYRTLDWPAQSPDLNPIENMWALLKRRLNEYETAPRGMLELNERVTEVWYDKMTIAECQKVIDSMPKRIKACLRAKGKWTKY